MQKRSFYRTWTSDIPVTGSGCIRIRVTGVSVYGRKLGWDCTRKSDISVIRSGCIRFHLDFEVHEKATRRSQDPDFACSCLSKTLNYCTRKSEIPVTRSGFVRILDILILKLTRIAWRACHFCVGKLGFHCTRKSDTLVTGSGWNRTLEIQKFYFACLLLASWTIFSSIFSSTKSMKISVKAFRVSSIRIVASYIEFMN